MGKPPHHVTPSHWTDAAIRVTGILPNGPEMGQAKPITEVWPKFVAWCESLVPQDKNSCLVAWNGVGSDCKWIFKIVEEQYKKETSMRHPDRMWYFMDPRHVIKHYTSCKLNQRHSGVLGYGLSEVWCKLTGNDRLENAHSSIVDAHALPPGMPRFRTKDHLPPSPA